MNKPSLIVIFLHRDARKSVAWGFWGKWIAPVVVAAVICMHGSHAATAQEPKTAAQEKESETAAQEKEPAAAQEKESDPAQANASDAAAKETPAAEEKSEPVYPLGVAVDGKDVYAVDLDLPGVWKSGESLELFVRGTKLLRKPMNRPRCVILHPAGGILVGDSATREVYWIESAGAEPKPLTDGHLGIAMALTLDKEGKMLYVGDAEKRATFRLPIEGGKPELVARVNARGLAFDAEGKLWAVTPDDAAIQRIDVESNEIEEIVTGRPFQYPNGLCWAGDHGYVTDGYGKCIWKFTADGKTEKWHEGEPLVGPVGIAVTDESVFVADPKQKQVYEFDRKTKKAKPRL